MSFYKKTPFLELLETPDHQLWSAIAAVVTGSHLRTVIAAVTSAANKHCKGCQQLAFELTSLNNINEPRLTSECFEQTQQTKIGPGSNGMLWVRTMLV